MPKIVVTARDGSQREIDATASLTLMEVIRDEDFDIEALCGGCCSCATCHVYVDPQCKHQVPAMSEDEDLLLDGSSHRDAELSRLSCQIRVTEEMDGLKLTVALAG